MTDCISGYISLGKEQLHYTQIGSGSKLLLAFHGYGNNCDIFEGLCKALSAQYTCLSFDLPHHGKSSWDVEHLTEQQIMAVVNECKTKFNVDKVSLVGYSMGGRVCLKLTELMPDVIDKVVLIASDGLRFNSFYYFLTRTTSGKALFGSFLKNPKPYSYFIETVRKLKMVNTIRYNFAMRYIRAEEDRNFLLKVWPCMSLLIPDINRLKTIIPQNNIQVNLFMGKHDTIIPVSLGKQFIQNIPSAQLTVLDKGHKVLDTDTIPVIAKSLLV